MWHAEGAGLQRAAQVKYVDKEQPRAGLPGGGGWGGSLAGRTSKQGPSGAELGKTQLLAHCVPPTSYGGWSH